MSTSTMDLRSKRRIIALVLFVLVSAGLAMVALMIPLLVRLLSPSIEVGQVAMQDYRAPEARTFQSEVLTEQKRDLAVRSVLPVYTQPDPSIARQQLEQLRSALAYITNVRADSHAAAKQKLEDLAALDDIHLSQETAASILALSDSRWQAVQQEAIVVLEQVMRSNIRSDRVEEARNSMPALVSLSLSESQAGIVAELAAPFVVPNSLYSEALTEAARQEAAQAVTPVTRSYMAGETVVQRGRVLAAADLEALQQLGLAQPQRRWQDMVSAGVLVIVLVGFVSFYFHRRIHLSHNLSSLVLISVLFLSFLFAARLAIPDHTIVPYAFPLAGFGLLMAGLFGVELALVMSLPLAILAAYGLPNALDLTLYYILTSLFGILALGRGRRVTSFFWAGLAIAISGIFVILVYRLPQPTTDWVGVATLSGAALFSGLASASLTLLLQFFLAQFLGLTTPMQLMELMRPDHALLQELLREAPGTYQHSLQVANLAEQAAEQIGADAQLTRVGALYHDVGKILNAYYFIENQVPGFQNPHDSMDPISSAETIIRHIPEGLKVARKYRIPRRLLDFISEHHGTMVTRYQYVKAVTAAGGDESQVDKETFRYPGPRPQSRETAILMLADGCEARVRAEHPTTEEDLHSIIKSVIDNRVAIGQLDDTDLTLHDLDTILKSFTATLRGVYHPRVKYPTLEKNAGADEQTVPVPPLGERRENSLAAAPAIERKTSTSG